MELIDRLRAWSYRRQCLGHAADDELAALRDVVAVYATHPTSPLALWARTRTPSAARYRAIDDEATGIRIPAMRKTLFLVPRDTAALVFTAARPSEKEVLRALGRHDLSLDDYERVARAVLKAARKPARSQDLQAAAGTRGPVMGTILRCLRYEGRVVALAGDSLMSSPHRYVATSRWVEEGLDAGDATAALEWLAGEYLRSYGPARAVDFAWWAGVTKTGARSAVAAHDTIDLGEGLLMLREDEPAFSKTKRLKGTVDLLPRWDAYTMGHAPDGRARFVDPDVQARVYTPIGVGLSGDGNPVILVDGEAVGIWSYTVKGGPELVEEFEAFGPKVRRAVVEELEAVTAFLRS